MPDIKNEFTDEVGAISTILSVLGPLAAPVRRRVLNYVLSALSEEEPLSFITARNDSHEQPPPTATAGRLPDIRALVADKRPGNAIEMAAVVAYFLSELAPTSERKKSISTSDVEKYFKQGAYPLPNVLRVVLHKAKERGYLEPVKHGEYGLTSVGFNLVAHDLPRNSSKIEP